MYEIGGLKDKGFRKLTYVTTLHMLLLFNIEEIEMKINVLISIDLGFIY